MDFAQNLTLLLILGLAAFFDLRERRIPNWLILFGLLGGIGLAVFQGSTQLIISMVGFFCGILALFIPFALRWMGAGDVKLFAAVGIFVGYAALPRVFFYSCIAAGIIAVLALAKGYMRQATLRSFWSDCKFTFLTARMGLFRTLRLEPNTYSVPWGVAIGAGTIMAYYIDPTGTWAGF